MQCLLFLKFFSLLMMINGILEFLAVVNLNYTFALSNAAAHLATAAISTWLFHNLDFTNDDIRYICYLAWISLHTLFGLYMFSTAQLFANPEIAGKVFFQKMLEPSSMENRTDQRDDDISSEA